MMEFYRQFFGSDDIVFDVGANQGEYAEVFHDAGCGAVVAVEPNPAFKAQLKALQRFKSRITPEFAAIGAEAGTAVLHICDKDIYSTLASPDNEWIATSPDYLGVSWNENVEVPVLTLDELARKFGEAAFVKIDIEGYELEALKGMHFGPRFLSFEFGARRKDLGLACIDHLASSYVFRPMVGREYVFATERWLSASEAQEWLSALTVGRGEYGDMFARRQDLPENVVLR